MKNVHYKKYDKKKQKLKKKYPSDIFKKAGPGHKKIDYPAEQRKLHQSYLKELLDLIFENDGDYQKFSWDILSDMDKLAMERKARGRKWHYDYD